MDFVTSFVNIAWDVLNNTTFVALVVFFLTATLAKEEYRRQKDIDREADLKKEIIGFILSLQETIDLIIFVIDRTAYTKESISTEDLGIMEAYTDTVVKTEIPRLAQYINEDIPTIQRKIQSRVRTFYGENSEVTKEYVIFIAELLKWHQPLVEGKIDLTKKSGDQPTLSRETLMMATKRLIDAIWKGKVEHLHSN